MNKKTYEQPTLRVVELDDADIVNTSGGVVNNTSSNAGLSMGDDQSTYNGGSYAKGRGIWHDDE